MFSVPVSQLPGTESSDLVSIVMHTSRCPECGFSISETIAGGLCPGCLLASARSDTSPGSGRFFLQDGRARVVFGESCSRPLQIGPYRLTKQLGSGGMGTVWAAEQEVPVKRSVALKIIGNGRVPSREAISRFKEEGRALATLNHPNIVQFLEVGETETNEPFLVMELIDGTSLTGYCDTMQLNLQERLALLIPISRAVNHAHHRGIIHRDLKPGNILVCPDEEGCPVPKLIDFGIVKTLSETWDEKTFPTLDGQILGTPQYMSPEQARGGEVETLTDVYSLGVILYELITGTTPLNADFVSESSVETVLRGIRENEPERPSERIKKRKHRDKGPAEVRQLQDELDWIAMKCLEKTPSRRYDSPGALADDLQRYLDGDSISARPPSRAYRVKKFTRRNKALMISLTSIFGILTVATLLSVGWAMKATKAQQLANSRLIQADAVPEFLFRAFRKAAPEEGGAEMLALDVLRQVEKDAPPEFADQPLLRARIQESIGLTYRDLGRHDLSAAALNEAVKSALEVPGNDEAVSRLSYLLSAASRNSGNPETAIRISKQNWQHREATLGENAPETHKARLNYCRGLLEAAYWDDSNRDTRLNEVEAILNEVLTRRDRFPGANIPAYRAVEAQLAAGRGNHEKAYLFWTEEISRRYLVGSAETKGHYWPHSFLVASLRRTGRLEEALAAAESLFLHSRELYGNQHPNSTIAARYLAGVYHQLGAPVTSLLICQIPAVDAELNDPIFANNLSALEQWSSSLELADSTENIVSGLISFLKQGANLAEQELGLENLSPGTVFWLAELAWSNGDFQTGKKAFKMACEKTVARYGKSHPVTLVRSNRFAEKCIGIWDTEQAAEILLPQIESENLTWHNTNCLDLVLDYAAIVSKLGETDTGERLARKVFEIHRKTGAANPKQLNRCRLLIAGPLRQRRDTDGLVKFHETMCAEYSRILGPDHPATVAQRSRFAELTTVSGNAKQAN